MATKTYYGKLDCYSSWGLNGPYDPLTNEYWKGFCDFMTYLSGNNVVELVAWNSGVNIPTLTASFESRGYWNEPNMFGSGSFAIWKWLTSSTRNWEWYLYAQVVSGSQGIQFTHTTPITSSGISAATLSPTVAGDGFNSFYSVINTGISNPQRQNEARARGILVQAAVCISGTSSINPWNGTLEMGSAKASIAAVSGSARWVSGGINNSLSVLPRPNDFGGVNVYQKANGVPLGGLIYSGNLAGFGVKTYSDIRYHFVSDGDALVVALSPTSSLSYSFSYIGSFELRNSLSSSGIAGSKLGFCMHEFSMFNDNGIPLSLNIGSLVGNDHMHTSVNGTSAAGGAYFPLMTSGSKFFQANIGPFNTTTFQPNFFNNTYDEFPIFLGCSETLSTAYIGRFNPGLFKLVRSVSTHDTLGDYSRAAFGSSSVGSLKITIPWYGSTAPGVGTHRTGSSNTWTADYDP